MAATTPRYALHYPSSTDSTNIPGDLMLTFDEIDANIVMEFSGLANALPAAGIMGRRYYATDTQTEYFDNGAAWSKTGTIINTSAGNITVSLPGASSASGSVGSAADAGHIHGREPISVASDIQPSGRYASAGSTGKWVDAGHVHPGDSIGDLKASVTGFTDGVHWMVANGQAVSRSTYLTLYNGGGGAATWPWGQGDGSTTYNLPNLNDRTLVGAGNLYSVGQIFGATSATISTANLPNHSHTLGAGGTSSVSVAHTHSFPGTAVGQYDNAQTSSVGFTGFPAGGQRGYWNGSLTTDQGTNAISLQQYPFHAHTLTGSTDAGGGSSPQTPLGISQPSAGVIWLIKVL